MMGITETGNLTDENAKFARDFEEYKQLCREKYQQQNVEEEEECSSEDEGGDNGAADLCEEECEKTDYPVIKDPRFTVSAATNCNTTSSNSGEANGALKASVEVLKTKAGAERRNSLSKVMSFCSNVFKKSGGSSPTLNSQGKEKDKEKLKVERNKAEQDWRMAHFIAELEFEGRSDEEIQMHLFHLRDQAQFARPRSNSVGDWLRDMHQAFKDEFSARRDSRCVTVHVSTVNPFAAAAPANYVHDIGYSYEELVALESVPRGLQSLDHLPTLVYEGQEIPSSQITCAVCMADFQISEDLRSLHCSHHFHKECIDKWLGVATTCPVCKGEVLSE